jgi:hypothetical protein
MITHTTVTVKGPQQADVSAFHARTSDARIAMAFGGIHMLIYSCQVAQGLLEAFTAARGHMARIPREIPCSRGDLDAVRIALSMEWTCRPQYAVVAQSAPNKVNNAAVHWVDLYTGPVTWQLRDQVGLVSTIELLTRVHRTAKAVFLDGDKYSADPTSPGYTAS